MPSDTESLTPISDLDYETCRDQLVEIVNRLEQGGLGLDESLALWERGEMLAKRCEEHLAGARRKIAEVLETGEPNAANT